MLQVILIQSESCHFHNFSFIETDSMLSYLKKAEYVLSFDYAISWNSAPWLYILIFNRREVVQVFRYSFLLTNTESVLLACPREQGMSQNLIQTPLRSILILFDFRIGKINIIWF